MPFGIRYSFVCLFIHIGFICCKWKSSNTTSILKQTKERVSNTEWHNIVLRNKAAEICEKYLSKGDKVYIEGRIKTRKWQDDKGNDRYYGYNDCRVIEAAHVAGEEEVTLTVNGKSFALNLASMHEIREDSGTARPIQRKLTSQLQSETESAEDKAKHTEHLELSAELTK
jgi:single stranded DNA-binding protein